MWYKTTDSSELDYSKPIIAENSGKDIFLLLPQIEKESYEIVGYNWFDIKRGKYDSCVCFKTAEKAVQNRKGHIIKNATIEFKDI